MCFFYLLFQLCQLILLKIDSMLFRNTLLFVSIDVIDEIPYHHWIVRSLVPVAVHTILPVMRRNKEYI